jgi:hypothetical protein
MFNCFDNSTLLLLMHDVVSSVSLSLDSYFECLLGCFFNRKTGGGGGANVSYAMCADLHCKDAEIQ